MTTNNSRNKQHSLFCTATSDRETHWESERAAAVEQVARARWSRRRRRRKKKALWVECSERHSESIAMPESGTWSSNGKAALADGRRWPLGAALGPHHRPRLRRHHRHLLHPRARSEFFHSAAWCGYKWMLKRDCGAPRSIFSAACCWHTNNAVHTLLHDITTLRIFCNTRSWLDDFNWCKNLIELTTALLS